VDACLALWVVPSGLFAHHACRRMGIPYSVWALGSDVNRYGRYPVLHRVMKKVIQEARAVFADGFDLSKRVEERFKRKCFFLATTRSLAGNEEGMESSRLAGRRSYRFLFVGRLEKVKGIDVLLRAVSLLKDEKVDVHLTLIGRGRMEGWARDFVDKNGLRAMVDLLGNLSDKDLAMHYRSCDCVVIPSRSESIPLVFSEALQFDKELIVTDVGDMGMLGRRYDVAWVVPPEDPLAFKEMMKKRAGGEKNQGKERDEKRNELKQLFNIETSVERFLADYS
jgi:glycosyltransferase involved in cell wall biosynthesis